MANEKVRLTFFKSTTTKKTKGGQPKKNKMKKHMEQHKKTRTAFLS